jgi:hypothetical protein
MWPWVNLFVFVLAWRGIPNFDLLNYMKIRTNYFMSHAKMTLFAWCGYINSTKLS